MMMIEILVDSDAALLFAALYGAWHAGLCHRVLKAASLPHADSEKEALGKGGPGIGSRSLREG